MVAVLVAAGSGVRLGAGRPKALVEVGGAPLVATAVQRLQAAGAVRVVVVGPPDDLAAVHAALDGLDACPVVVVPGGDTRSASVRHGLAAVADLDDGDVVAVHDAARAFTPPAVIRAAVAAIADDVVAAAPALAVSDTLKRVEGTTVAGTVDRADLVAVQTPQAFRLDVLRRAHADAGDATDDLALVEGLLANGVVAGRIVTVPGSVLATKVTVPDDVRVLEALTEGAT